MTTFRGNKICREYNNTDVIQEEDEIRDELLTEVEELKRIADESRIKYKTLQTMHQKDPYRTPDIEKLLMKLEDFEKQAKKMKNCEKNEKKKFEELFFELRARNKTLRDKFKITKIEFLDVQRSLVSTGYERNALNEEFSELEIENESLRSAINDKISTKVKNKYKKSVSVSKKISQSTKNVFRPITLSKMLNKDSIGCSPLYNSSFQSLTHMNKKNPSFDISRLSANIPHGPIRLIRLQNK